MEMSTAHVTQLVIALLCGIALFVASSVISLRKILAFLVVIIPFQLVASRYGSLNMVLVYVVFFAFMFRSVIQSRPFFLAFLFILAAYLISTFSSLRALWFDHLIYVLSIVSNFLLFYITYNVIMRYPQPRLYLRILIAMNVLCISYSLVLYFIGYDKVAFLGVDEWTLNQNLEEKSRLLGAFQAAGVTATFYGIQILLLLYAAVFTEKGMFKYMCYVLAFVNFGLVVASGSRGSFLTMVGGSILFLFFLRKGLGVVRTTRYLLVGGICLTMIALYVVTQTEFNVLFERLAGTEVNQSGVPDTRQIGFERTMERLDEAIIVGHGPETHIYNDYLRHIPNYKPLGFYPHNLVLYLLYSIGIVGLSAYALFFGSIFWRLWRSRSNQHPDDAVRYVPALGIVVMTTFFADQLKIEFLRFDLGDFQHYVFYLLAMFAAFAKISRNPSLSPDLTRSWPTR